MHCVLDLAELIQEKAKLWADANIVKLVLVSNDEKTTDILRENDSSWSRADVDIYIRDLPDDAAREFLKLPPYKACVGAADTNGRHPKDMAHEYIERTIDAVGGRITHLLEFKFDWLKGIDFDTTLERLIQKELAKFHSIADDPGNWKVM